MTKGYYYSRFFDELNNRIDFVYYHPQFDKIKAFRRSNTSFPFSELIIKGGMDYGITASGKDEGRFKFVNTQNLSERGFIDSANIKYIDMAPENKLLNTNDILISRSRLVGRAASVTEEFKDATFGSYIIRFKLKMDNEYVIDFLVKYINCDSGQEQVTLLKTGSSGENINSGQLLDIRLPKISKAKQQEILKKVNAFESQAVKLENETQNIRKKAEKLLFSELGIILPKEEKVDYYTFPFDNIENRFGYGNYHPSVKQLEDSLKKARYKIKPLKELINIKYDSIEPSKNPDKKYYYIGLENIESNIGRLKSTLNLMGKEISSKSNVFKRGQLLYSGLRPYLNKCFILEDYDDAIGSAELFICEAKEGVSLRFLKWYLLSEVTLRQTK